MPGEDKFCDSHSHRGNTKIAEVLASLVIFPCHVCFAVYFLCQLYNYVAKKGENRMITATVIFILCSVSTSSLAFFNEVIEPIRQTKYAPCMEYCATGSFLRWFSVSGSYTSLIAVMLARIETVFQNSIQEVSTCVRCSFQYTLGGSLLISATMSLFHAASMDCWLEQRMGVLSGDIFPESVYECGVENRYDWIRAVASVNVILVFVVTAVILLIMFLQRLLKMDQVMSDMGIVDSVGFSELIQQSTLICVLGLISTVLCIILATVTAFGPLVYGDFLFNCLLLYCLYGFGKPTYNMLFSWILNYFECFQLPNIRTRMVSNRSNTATNTPTNASSNREIRIGRLTLSTQASEERENVFSLGGLRKIATIGSRSPSPASPSEL